jgi:hypothetical protein
MAAVVPSAVHPVEGGYGGQAMTSRMIDEEPTLIGNPHLGAYVGAIGEHLAQRWRGRSSVYWCRTKKGGNSR